MRATIRHGSVFPEGCIKSIRSYHFADKYNKITAALKTALDELAAVSQRQPALRAPTKYMVIHLPSHVGEKLMVVDHNHDHTA